MNYEVQRDLHYKFKVCIIIKIASAPTGTVGNAYKKLSWDRKNKVFVLFNRLAKSTNSRLNSSRRVATLDKFCESKSSSA